MEEIVYKEGSKRKWYKSTCNACGRVTEKLYHHQYCGQQCPKGGWRHDQVEEREERNERIKRLRQQGWTLRALGQEYGISGERVRQLLGGK